MLVADAAAPAAEATSTPVATPPEPSSPLAELIAPLSVADFEARHWEQRPLLVERPEEPKDFLARSTISVHQKGPRISGSHFCK